MNDYESENEGLIDLKLKLILLLADELPETVNTMGEWGMPKTRPLADIKRLRRELLELAKLIEER